MANPISSFSDLEIVSKTPISDSIRKLQVIHCDMCKKADASYDVFVRGIEGVAFLRRYCDNCLKNIT